MSFISEEYLKSIPILNRNVDAQIVAPFATLAAEMFTQVILGKYFYTDLLAKFQAQTLTTDEETLVALVKKAVAFRAAEMALPNLDVQVTNKGPQIQSGDFSENPGYERMESLRREWKGYAGFYENEIKAYLKLNGDNFASYTSKENQKYIAPDKTDNFETGLDII